MPSAFETTTRKVSATLSNADSKYIKSIHYNQSITDGSYLTMGTVNSATLEIELMNVPKLTASGYKKGNTFTASFTAEHTEDETTTTATASIGRFYITDVKIEKFGQTGNYTVKITANDAISLIDDSLPFMENMFKMHNSPFFLHNETPSPRWVVSLIASIYGLGIRNAAWSDDINSINAPKSIPENATARQVVSYYAALQGTCAFINEMGQLDAAFIGDESNTLTIPQNMQYLNGLDFNVDQSSSGDEETQTGEAETVLIRNLICSGTSSYYEYGAENPPSNSSTLHFNCPVMKGDEGMQYVYNEKIRSSRSYTPFSVEWRGLPSTKIFSKLNVIDSDGTSYFGYLMERDLYFDGGLKETYKCVPPSNEKVELNPKYLRSDDEDTIINIFKDYMRSIDLTVYPTNSDGVYDDTIDTQSEYCDVTYSATGGDIEIVKIKINELYSGHRLNIPLPYTPSGSNSRTGNGFLIPSFFQIDSQTTSHTPTIDGTTYYLNDVFDYFDGRSYGSYISNRISTTLFDNGISARYTKYDFTADGISGLSINAPDGSHLVLAANTDQGYIENVQFAFLCFKYNAFNQGAAVLTWSDKADMWAGCYPYNPDNLET